MNADYYEDRRFCSRCRAYVHYLYSPETSFCIECGARVALFSDPDHEHFQRALRLMRADFDLSAGGDREAG